MSENDRDEDDAVVSCNTDAGTLQMRAAKDVADLVQGYVDKVNYHIGLAKNGKELEALGVCAERAVVMTQRLLEMLDPYDDCDDPECPDHGIVDPEEDETEEPEEDDDSGNESDPNLS